MTHVFPPFEPEKAQKRPRRLALRRGQVPVRVLIPNMFTLLGLCAGLTAIRMAIEHRWDVALAAIIFAAFIDGIDGRVARLLKATSQFGAQLDSLADFINFGVAPAVVVFAWALGGLKSLGWIVVLVFAICAALRLARFNVSLDDPDQPDWKANYFVGVPAPAGALILLLPLYLDGLGVPGVAAVTPVILVYTLGVAFLMVSRIPTYSGKMIGQRVDREYVAPVFVLAALFVAVLLTYPFTTLTVGTLLYLVFIPVSFWTYGKREQEAKAHATAQNGAEERAESEVPDKPEEREQARP
ncbi:MAG: CDP-diacylglycerol--serine O-phosphatidyltransferase [Methyloligellaceae bacterium]